MNRVLFFALVFLCLGVLNSTQVGAQPPHIDGYTVSWYDEFDGNTLDTSKWTASNTNNTTNNSLQDYLPSQVTVSNGLLKIKSENIPSRGLPYRSGLVESDIEQQYGRFEIRAKLPTSKGMWPAIWLLPNTGQFPWPSQGEIDIMENRGDEPFTTSSAFHYGTNPPFVHNFVYAEQKSYTNGNVNYHDSFHTYACEWDPDQVRFFIDGVNHYTVYNDWTGGFLSGQTAQMALIINTAVGGHFLDNPDNTTVWPQTLEVDYVHVWTKDGTAPDLAIENSDFEANNGSLASWTTFGNRIPNVQSHREFAETGSNSLKLFGQFNDETNYSGVTQGLTVDAGDEVIASASSYVPNDDAMSGANRAVLKIDFYSEPNQAFGSADYISSVEVLLANSSSPRDVWVNKTLEAVAPAGTKEARVAILHVQENDSGGAVFVDNVMIDEPRIPIDVPPATIATVRGSFAGGAVSDIGSSDNADYRVRRAISDVLSITTFEVTATSHVADPIEMQVRLEGAVFARGNVVQSIRLFNFDTMVFEVVDSRNAVRTPSPDSVVEVTVNGDLSRFVEPSTNRIQARVEYRSDANRQKFTSNTDHFLWTIR